MNIKELEHKYDKYGKQSAFYAFKDGLRYMILIKSKLDLIFK